MILVLLIKNNKNTSMSVIIAKGEQITKCSNNTSTSNQMFSFGVGNRFKKRNASLTQNYYDIPSSFKPNNNKGCAMGFGSRQFLNNYNKKDNNKQTYYYKESSLIKKQASCSSFGKPPKQNLNESVLKLNSSNSLMRLEKNGNNNNSNEFNTSNYNTNNKNNKTSRDWKTNTATIKGKLKTFLDVKYNDVPGPGQYPVHKSSSCFKIDNNNKISRTGYFSHTTEKRFQNLKYNGVPGPKYVLNYGNIGSNYEKYLKISKDKALCSSSSTNFNNNSNSNNNSMYNTNRMNGSMNLNNTSSSRLNFNKESDKCKKLRL